MGFTPNLTPSYRGLTDVHARCSRQEYWNQQGTRRELSCWSLKPLVEGAKYFSLWVVYDIVLLILRPALVLRPKLFWDDCWESHFWWPLQYLVAFHYVEMVKLHVPHEASWGTWLLSFCGESADFLSLFSALFYINLKKNLQKPSKTLGKTLKKP
jgi:hypothetical protein